MQIGKAKFTVIHAPSYNFDNMQGAKLLCMGEHESTENSHGCKVIPVEIPYEELWKVKERTLPATFTADPVMDTTKKKSNADANTMKFRNLEFICENEIVEKKPPTVEVPKK